MNKAVMVASSIAVRMVFIVHSVDAEGSIRAACFAI
jgi:hypothetical protein